jgi:hypothetical protein
MLLEASAKGDTKCFSLLRPDAALVGNETKFKHTNFGVTTNLLKVSTQVSHGEIAEVVHCPSFFQATGKKKPRSISMDIVVAIIGDIGYMLN